MDLNFSRKMCTGSFNSATSSSPPSSLERFRHTELSWSRILLRPSNIVCSVSPFISVVIDLTSPITPLCVAGIANYRGRIGQ